MAKTPLIPDAQRRARLAARHHLARKAPDPVAATRGVVALHSSDPVTPYLSAWARVGRFATADLDGALHAERSLWRLHAMRRTLWVVPADAAWVFEGAAGREVAARERKRLEGWLGAERPAREVAGFVADLEARVMAALADGSELRTQELSAAIPGLATEVTLGSGRWTTRSPISSRLLFLIAMDGRIVRTRPAGSWRSSQYHWAATERWFGAQPEPADAAVARTELARLYLDAFGPATLDDVRWWTGWTAKQATAAVKAAGAVAVRLEDGSEGLVLGDDVAPRSSSSPPAGDGVSFLPALDPTPMGWKARRWFLAGHAARLFDRNGNAGPTVWLDGRVVGGWAQRRDGAVRWSLLEDVGREAERRVAEEAARLETWLGGVVVTPRFRTPLERELSAP